MNDVAAQKLPDETQALPNDLSHQLAKRAQNYDVVEFVDGQQDCRDGVPHKAGMSESYDAGYGAQYELEQIMEARSER